MKPHNRKPISPDVALERLMALCVGAEHCRHEMMAKLSSWGIAPDNASRIIATLKKSKFIDDRRFAVAYAHDKARFNAWGCRKIRLGLLQKHIADDDITAALAEIDPEDYRQGLLQTIRSKIISLGPEVSATYEGRTKIFRHAASRGFEPEMIAGILRDRGLMDEMMQCR